MRHHRQQFPRAAWVLACLAACAEPGPPTPIAAADPPEQVSAAVWRGEAPTDERFVPAAPPGAAVLRRAKPRHCVTLHTAPLPEALLVGPLEEAALAAEPPLRLTRVRCSERAAISGAERDADAVALITDRTVAEVGDTLRAQRLGYHVAALVVAVDNPVTTLTERQLRQTLAGHTDRWQLLGYHRGQIRLLLPPDDDAGRRLLAMLLPGGRLAPLAERASRLTSVLEGTAADVTALGVVPLAARRAAVGLRTVAVHGVAPTHRTAANGTYPYATAIHLLHRGDRSEAVQALIDFLASAPGRALLAAQLTTP